MNLEIGSAEEPWTVDQQERLKRACANSGRAYPVVPLSRQRASEYLSALQTLGLDNSMRSSKRGKRRA